MAILFLSAACEGEIHIHEDEKHQVPGFPIQLCQVQEHHLETPIVISTWHELTVGKWEEGGQVGGDLGYFAGAEVGSGR